MFTFIRLNFPAKPLLTYLKKSYNLQLLDLLLLLVFQKQKKQWPPFLSWFGRHAGSYLSDVKTETKITKLLLFYKQIL